MAYADNSLLGRVQNKFLSDKQVFEEFVYLGELYCVDNQLTFSDSRLFNHGYINLFNGLSAFARFIDEQRLKQNFLAFENKHLSDKTKIIYDEITQCRQLYRSPLGFDRYRRFVLDKKNYAVSDYMNVQMLDYLETGRLSACHFIDCNSSSHEE